MPRTKLEIPKILPFSTGIPIRIGDINYGGHLGNDAVLSIVHEARVRFLGELGYTEMNVEGKGIIMTDAVVVYKSEGFYGDVLRVEVGVTDVQAVGCDFVYRLTNAKSGKEVASAKTGIVFLDYQTRKVSSVPEAFKSKFSATDSTPL
jgi:acyl-CoA thioester hydrolase